MPKETAETLSSKLKDISVAEFFAKNRHLLGFDSPRKALLTTVKEAVDNSLDACEEAGILPTLVVSIEDLQPNHQSSQPHRFRVTVLDNGPGITRKNIENVFGRLLFGSKFHRLKMSRGQQGIGISAAGMYGLITTGKPMQIYTKTSAKKAAAYVELAINTKSNRAEVSREGEFTSFPRVPGIPEKHASDKAFPTGTSVSIELEAVYRKGKTSVDEFLELVAIANPHAQITFVWPSRYYGTEDTPQTPSSLSNGVPEEKDAPSASDGLDPNLTTVSSGNVTIFPRSVSELPPSPVEIQPHPQGVELGTLIQMIRDASNESPSRTVADFIHTNFCCIDTDLAEAFCDAIKVSPNTLLSGFPSEKTQLLHRTFKAADLQDPPTDCLSPIGVRNVLSGLLKGVKAEFYAASSRPPRVYRGRPFQIEAGLAFGGDIPAESSARVLRIANRVPLQNLSYACCTTKAVEEVNWKAYSLEQPKNSLPSGPVVIMLHMASVWVPFTSESKEAIADYDEIREEMRQALQECGRKLSLYMKKRLALLKESQRRDVFKRYIAEVSKAVTTVAGGSAKEMEKHLFAIAQRKTALADATLDDSGKLVRQQQVLQRDSSVVVVESRSTAASNGDPE